uniref:hypothetical protein n=1 Tax=uncultured Allobacillus sp. TaxID=1638025 RepID=UPI002596C9CC|nr:hypothetical protein [uncultured Allobacillus sp.]
MNITEEIKMHEDVIGYLLENARIAIANGNYDRAKAYFENINQSINTIEKLKKELHIKQEMKQIAGKINCHKLVYEMFLNVKKDR